MVKAASKANKRALKDTVSSEERVYNSFRSADTVDYFFPLLSLDPETASIDDFVDLKQWELLSPLLKEKGNSIASQLRKNSRDALPYLRETVEYLRKIVFIASVDHDLPKEETEAVESWIKETLTNSEGLVVLWERPGSTFVGAMNVGVTRWDGMIIYLRVLAVKEITAAFKAGFGKRPEILNHYGACPVCRSIMRKRRKDQVYCSVQCGNLARDRKRRGNTDSRY